MCPQMNLSKDDYRKVLDQVEQLSNQGRFQSAMKIILEVLEEVPDDEFALDMATLVIYTSQSRTRAYSASEPLTSEYLSNTLLDSIFCECSKCNATWVINPMAKMAAHLSINAPLGGYCPRCKKVFCRNCYEKRFLSKDVGTPSMGSCPECHSLLETIMKPTGRKPRQAPRKKKPVRFFILLREGPVPPTAEYLNRMIRLISPDVLTDQPELFAAPVPNWSGNQRDLTGLMYAIAAQRDFPLDEVETYFFSPDENGCHFCIAKVY